MDENRVNSCPSHINLSKADSLREKINIIRSHCYYYNTNLETIFNLILKFSVSYHLSQKEFPSNILILSDMEFDSMVDLSSLNRRDGDRFINHKTNTTITTITVIQLDIFIIVRFYRIITAFSLP
ncbi:hypothetical protein PIROE2DRAFT_5401 [Piromyces sp. E2]|nr:hypothetical protein PIROE2DRAFT_5401 [Piromyces sp. E2]|eukprot:OUM67238.1 hypothetical protein PIROE2DRAFT_5401 [Piromyces sp. E2]